MGEPFSPDRAGCGGHGVKGHCNAAPTWDGVKYFPHSRNLWRAFACDEHAHQLDVGRPLNADSRAELARRWDIYQQVRAGALPHEPEQPLATGAAALAKLDRDRRYAERHPEDGWEAPPRRRPASREGAARTGPG